MVKNHLKRIAAPRTWKIKRKSTVFVTKPNPGPHSLEYGLPLRLVLNELLNMVNNKKEANALLNDKVISVDRVVRKDPRYSVGLFDVLSVLGSNENYRCIFNKKGKLEFMKIIENESKIKPCKIIGKKKVRDGFQLNLYDGKNIMTNDNNYKVGDSIMISLPEHSIIEHLPLIKGSTIMLIAGKHAGQIGNVEDIRKDNLIYRDDNGKSHETLKLYAYVVGKDKPIINLEIK